MVYDISEKTLACFIFPFVPSPEVQRDTWRATGVTVTSRMAIHQFPFALRQRRAFAA
jgi:hypothetical protein